MENALRLAIANLVAKQAEELAGISPALGSIFFAVQGAIIQGTEDELCNVVDAFVQEQMKKIKLGRDAELN